MSSAGRCSRISGGLTTCCPSSADSGAAGGGAGSATPAKGQFVGILPGPPGSGPPDITGGGTGGLGGTGSTITGIGDYSVSPSLGAGYQITPSGASGGFAADAGQQILAALKELNATSRQTIEAHRRLIAVTAAAPHATGERLGQALNGAARTAYHQARYNASGAPLW